MHIYRIIYDGYLTFISPAELIKNQEVVELYMCCPIQRGDLIEKSYRKFVDHYFVENSNTTALFMRND